MQPLLNSEKERHCYLQSSNLSLSKNWFNFDYNLAELENLGGENVHGLYGHVTYIDGNLPFGLTQ